MNRSEYFKICLCFAFGMFFFNTQAQIFNQITNVPQEFVPSRGMLLESIDKNSIYYKLDYIDKSGDSFDKIVKIDSLGNFIAILKDGAYEPNTDSFYHFYDYEYFDNQLWGFGAMLYNYEKTSDTIWAIYAVVCPIDRNTLKPQYSQKYKKFVGFAPWNTFDQHTTRYHIIQGKKLIHIKYVLYDQNFKVKDTVGQYNLTYDIATHQFSLEEIKAPDFKAIANILPYQHHFYTIYYQYYSEDQEEIKGEIFKYDYQLNRFFQKKLPYKDTSEIFDLHYRFFKYGIRLNGQTIGFTNTATYKPDKGKYKFDSAHLIAFGIENDTIHKIKKISLEKKLRDTIFGNYVSNDIVINEDSSLFLTFWNGMFGVAEFVVVKLDKNLNVIWSRIYNGKAENVYYLAENDLMRSISDKNGGLFLPFVARDEKFNRYVYVLWIDKNGNPKKMGLKDLTEDSSSEIISSQSSDIIFLYPNPASTELTVKIPNANSSNYHSVQLYDMLGREQNCIQTQYGSTLNLKIDELPTGIYLLKVIGKEGSTLHTERVEIRR